jgi:hypothetical protein
VVAQVRKGAQVRTLLMAAKVCEELGLATVARDVTPGLWPVMETARIDQELMDCTSSACSWGPVSRAQPGVGPVPSSPTMTAPTSGQISTPVSWVSAASKTARISDTEGSRCQGIRVLSSRQTWCSPGQ